MTDLFQRIWLRTDTYIDNLSPGQRRQLRTLCEKFFEEGRKMPRAGTPVPKTAPGNTHKPAHNLGNDSLKEQHNV